MLGITKNNLLQKKLNNKVGSVVGHNSICIKSSLRPITATDSQHLKKNQQNSLSKKKSTNMLEIPF
jgi:hypothetical protein